METQANTGQRSGPMIGYIGLGAMGGAIARRLALGAAVMVYDLNSKLVDSLTQAGAIAADSPAHVARECDVVLICVPRSSNVQDIIFGKNGLLEGMSPGKVIIDQTSGDPTETRRMGAELIQHGVHMLDAPVSGGSAGAKAGTIAIMVGGDAEVFARAKPTLEIISPNITHCGELGSGQVVKLINNTISTCNRLAMLEGVAMGVRNGIDPAILQRVLNSGGAHSRSTDAYLPVLVEGRARSDFALTLMLKDLNLASTLSMQSEVPLPFGQLARNVLQAAAHLLGPSACIDDVADVVASQAGIEGYVSGNKGTR